MPWTFTRLASVWTDTVKSVSPETTSFFDETRMPSGSRGWGAFIDWVRRQPDTSETDWLEMKSDVDPNDSAGVGKIVKFILGAANRDPALASRFLGGHAVMVLGFSGGHAKGVPPIEDHVLEQKMHRFLGADGPSWDTQRFAAEGVNEVLVIITDPPSQGDRAFPCRADGSGVNVGDIYIRSKSQTRKATAVDHDMLYRRGLPKASSPSAPSISIELTTAVSAYTFDDQSIDGLVSRMQEQLLRDLPSEVLARKEAADRRRTEMKNFLNTTGMNAPGGSDIFGSDNSRTLIGLGATGPALRAADAIRRVTHSPETRTEDQYREQVNQYADDLRETLPSCIDHIVQQVAPRFEILLTNTSDEPLEDLTIELHLNGPIEALDHISSGRARGRRVVPVSPRRWGPKPIVMVTAPEVYFPANQPVQTSTPPPPNTASAKTTGSVTLTLNVASLRSREQIKVRGTECLVLRDAAREVWTGGWEARARNIRTVLAGTVELTAAQPVDLTPTFIRVIEEGSQTGTLVATAHEDA